jgi:hypothetical protein
MIANLETLCTFGHHYEVPLAGLQPFLLDGCHLVGRSTPSERSRAVGEVAPGVAIDLYRLTQVITRHRFSILYHNDKLNAIISKTAVRVQQE